MLPHLLGFANQTPTDLWGNGRLTWREKIKAHVPYPIRITIVPRQTGPFDSQVDMQQDLAQYPLAGIAAQRHRDPIRRRIHHLGLVYSRLAGSCTRPYQSPFKRLSRNRFRTKMTTTFYPQRSVQLRNSTWLAGAARHRCFSEHRV